MEDLIDKVKREFALYYLNIVGDAKIDISIAYELVIKSEIVDAIEYDIVFPEKTIKYLLNFDGNLLDYFYNEWIDFDNFGESLRDILIPSIEYGAKQLKEWAEIDQERSDKI